MNILTTVVGLVRRLPAHFLQTEEQHMAYKTASLQTAKTLITNLKSLTDELKELEKDKKNKDKVAKLKKD